MHLSIPGDRSSIGCGIFGLAVVSNKYTTTTTDCVLGPPPALDHQIVSQFPTPRS